MVPHWLEHRERKRSVVSLYLHPRECPPYFGVSLPLGAVTLKLANQLSQVRNSFEHDAGLPFGCHE